MGTVTSTVTSADGTIIAFERSGTGRAVVLVDGSLVYRAFDQGGGQLAELLSEHFTVYRYDRRGRGDSTDTQPHAVAREIEDLEALIDEAGGSACVRGVSSGGALALEGSIHLPGKIEKLAIYEVPYNDDEAARHIWKEYAAQLGEVLAAGRRGDAVALLMGLTGATSEQVDEVRQTPMWSLFEAVAPTLAYDAAALGEDASLPKGHAARVAVPTLALSGGSSYPFMHTTAAALAEAIPDARHHVLGGQTHEVEASALAPVLTAFFGEERV